jgi:hypothetical protein
MKPVSEILGGLEEQKTEAAEAIARARAETKNLILEKAQALEVLKGQIIAGEETTGSPLHDGVVALYGGELARDPIIENYEKVSDQIKGKTGQPVVVMNRWTENENACTGFGGSPGGKRLVRMSSVGVLSGEDILFDYGKNEAYLPTSSFMWRKAGFNPPEQPITQNLPVDNSILGGFGHRPSLGLDLGRDLNTPESGLELWYEGMATTALDVLVGYDDIQEWLLQGGDYAVGRNGDLSDIRQMCAQLGIKQVEPATSEQKRYLRY